MQEARQLNCGSRFSNKLLLQLKTSTVIESLKEKNKKARWLGRGRGREQRIYSPLADHTRRAGSTNEYTVLHYLLLQFIK